MKLLKVLFIGLLIANAFTGNAQEKTAPGPTPLGGCPPGYHPAISIIIDQFNFHRPKYNCEKGFSICIRLHTELDCTEDRPVLAPFFKDGTVHAYGILMDKKVELHLPAGLLDLPEYANEDMSVFSMEKDWVEIYSGDIKIGSLKEGDYAVNKTEKELIITVDLE